MSARGLLLSLAMSLTSGIATAETLTWEAVFLAVPGKQIVGRGVRTYSPAKDIVVEERSGRDGEVWWSKALLLDDTFAVEASVHRARQLNGFGLSIARRASADGFSWEWFDRARGNIFHKLQGTGSVSIRVKRGSNYEELEAIEFLDDIVLRYLDDMSKPPGTHTHEVTIRKGSVLRVAP